MTVSIQTSYYITSRILLNRQDVVLFGSAADKAASDAVAAACSIPLLDTTGATDIPRGASLVARAKLIVTNDTGALHIAAAAGTPAVAVCGASSWIRETAPWAEGHVLLQAPSGPASPANSGRPQSKVPEGADPLEVLPAELALACCLYGLGVSKPAVLRKALDAAGAAAWETRFIPAGVDPIGGLDLVPLHTDSPDAAAVFDRILRHLFAWDFTSGSNSPIDDAAIGRYLSGAREAGIVTGKPGLKTLLATVRKMTQQLEEMAAEASRVASLFSAGGEASSSERRRLLEDLVAKGETLCDPETVPPALAPVTMTLDWQLRMMAPGSPLEVLEAHRERYHRAATILEKAAAIVKRLAAA